MAYKVFICHAYRHQDIYFELVQKLNAETSRWRNLSVQYDMRLGFGRDDVDDERLREVIGGRIHDCEVFLVLTKPVASRRRWLQWEIMLAKELGKPIIGIARRRNDRVSRFVKTHATDIVDTWRIAHIVNAIREYAQDYRPQQHHRRVALKPLPVSAPDDEEAPNPSPLAPDETSGPVGPAQAELPRDVLFRDIRDVASGNDMPIPSQEIRVPRWWPKARS